MKYFFMLSVLISVISCTQGQGQPTGITLLPAKDFAKNIENPRAKVILDVRTPDEFSQGHIQNAVNVDWNGNSFASEIAKIDPATPVYVYCYAGGRSSAAAKDLKKKGFKQIYDLKGGMAAWREAGLPEEK